MQPLAEIQPRETFREALLAPGEGKEKIVVVPLQGLISYSQEGLLGNNMVQDLKRAFEQAGNDSDVKAVVLLVDSPGGEMTAGDAIYHSLAQLREKKPVVVYMTSLGASAAYYISCGASWIMSNESTFTGSIGVIISTLNYENLFDKIGLKSVIFKSGAFKDMLSGSRPLTEEESAYVQGMVMQAYDRFVGLVASARHLDEKKLRDGVADGRVLSGLDAREAGLVDQLGYEEDAFEKARELGEAPGAKVVAYRAEFGLARLFRLMGNAKMPKIEVGLGQAASMRLEPGRLYLLPAIYAP